jgi:hypothetical protein
LLVAERDPDTMLPRIGTMKPHHPSERVPTPREK